jgi:hypothetical protein
MHALGLLLFWQFRSQRAFICEQDALTTLHPSWACAPVPIVKMKNTPAMSGRSFIVSPM